MHSGTSKIVIAVTSLLIFACAEEDDPLSLNDVANDVDLELRQYIETFVDEGAERGHFFDFDMFSGSFTTDDIDENGDICGQASAFSDRKNTILIKRDDRCWIQQPNASREALVFHELGHALLDRPHRDDRFDNGQVKSIMETGTLGPYNQFTPLLRQYLFNEMFDESTPDPEWIKNRTAELIFDINSDFEEGDTGWQFFAVEDPFNEGGRTGEASSEFASSGSNSLKMQVNNSHTGSSFYRLQLGGVTGIPETADIEISVDIRMQSISGDGVAFAGGIEKSGDILSFTTSEVDLELTGTTDFETHTITVPYWPSTSANFTIVLAILPNTVGVVYFDNLRVVAKYNPDFG
ncbi:MAG: hypothetical protein RJQ09_05090 [Cyclobacteriaceae bacterium]